MLYSFNNIQWIFTEHLLGATHCGRSQREKISKTEQICYHVHDVLSHSPLLGKALENETCYDAL